MDNFETQHVRDVFFQDLFSELANEGIISPLVSLALSATFFWNQTLFLLRLITTELRKNNLQIVLN